MFDRKYQDFDERKPAQLVILEGPDHSGKSTLALELSRSLTLPTVHHGPYPRISAAHLPRLYLEGMFPLLQRWHGQIMDRSWLSEQVYGPVYRGTDRMDPVHRRHLERIALRHGAVVVRCQPDWDTVRKGWARRKGMDPDAEMLDNEGQLKAVYDGYLALETELPTVLYNYTIHGHSNKTHLLADEVKRVAPKLHQVKQPTVGNWSGKVVLVGDRPSDHTDADTLWQYPFCSFSKQGSSYWLTQQLIAGGIRELDLLWCNAHDGLWWLDEVYRRPVIALGQAASDTLTERGIDHHMVPHPQHQKRFSGKVEYPLVPMLQNLTK